MAVTAKFQADFSSFIAAIDKAEVELADFGKGAEKVEKSLNRMIDNFSGRKLIQEASLMTIAIEKAGGVAALTASELERVGNKANEAAEKLKKMGFDVPPGLQRVADLARGAAEETLRIGEAAKTATQQSSGLSNMLGIASKLAGAFGLAFGAQQIVSGVVNFGKQILADADALTKLHDKTGISVEGLQRLQIAGDDAGNTIEDLSGAVNQMQKRLGSGADGAIGALESLGLRFADLKNLQPDQQFITIADAIRKIDDPMRQIAVGTEIFGKNFAEVLPTIKRGFDDIKDRAVGASAEAVEALDKLGDKMAEIARRTKGSATNIAGNLVLGKGTGTGFEQTTDDLADIRDQLKLMGAEAERTAPKLFFTQPIANLKELGFSVEKVIKPIGEMSAEMKKSADEAKEAAKAHKAFADSVQSLTSNAIGARAGFGQFGALVTDISARSGKFRDHMDDLAGSFNEFHGGITAAGDEMATVTIPLFAQLPNVVAQGTKALKAASDQVSKGSFFGGLKDIFSGKGFGQIGDALKDNLNPSKILNNALGGLLSGGIQSLLNLAGKGLSSLFAKIFDNPEKKINPIREAFVQAAGGLDTLNKKAHDAGITLDHLLDAKNPEQYTKAIEELNEAFEFQDHAMAKLNDAIRKYGFTLDELGPALQRQGLDEQAQTLYEDFRLLTAAGIDHTAVLTRMADGVNEYVQSAATLGIEVPSSLEPVLKQMIELGLLTDKDGKKIENLEDTGISFSQTLTQGFKSVVEAVEKLTAAISGKLGTALNNLPDSLPDPFETWRVPEVEEFRSESPIPMARGGMGRVTKPTLFLAGESGPEDVAFSGGGKSFGGGNGTAVNGPINFTVQLPPGSEISNPMAFVEGLKAALRTDTGLIRTAVEGIVDRRIASAA